MQLLKIDDPRSALERARRPELVRFARSHGLSDITEAMPANLIRKRLRAKGLTNIQVPVRPLGNYVPQSIDEAVDVPSVDADDILERDFTNEQHNVEKPIDQMNMKELRAGCRAKGIKMVRTDNLDTLRDKLRGQNAD